MDIGTTIKEFLNSDFLVYALYVYLFALIFYTVYSALNYFKYFSRMKKTLMSLYSRMSDSERSRADAERQERDLHGTKRKKDILDKLDEELAYSGLKEQFRWLTTELYILIEVITVALVAAISALVKGPFTGFVAGFIVVIIFKATISIMANIRDRKTEAIMLQFMNIVDNFAKTSDDLMTIFEKASRYIDEPLSTQIYDAVIEARNTGDSLVALQDLQDKVKNKHFKVLVRNLEISSRFETNYSEIIEDCREIFHTYIRSEKEKRTMRTNGVMQIFAMLAVGALCCYLIGDVTDQGGVISVLLNAGAIGYVILGFGVIVLLASIYIAVFQVLRKD